ncbi:MAG TPA: prenyltransferase [Ktedonobacterales bacterium]
MEDSGPNQADDLFSRPAPMGVADTVSLSRVSTAVNATSSPRVSLRASADQPSSLSQIKAWARVGRLPTLACAVGPALVTGAWLWAQGLSVRPATLLVTAVAMGLTLGGANVMDAYLDHVRAEARMRAKPATTPDQKAPHSWSALLDAGIYPLDALRIAIALFVAGAALGLSLAVYAGWPGLLLGGAGMLTAFLYSATNYALKRQPLGEVAVLLGLGPGIVAFTLLVQGRPLTQPALLLGLGLGFLATALLEAANLRAISPEIRDGRRTSIRLLGLRHGRWVFAACFISAYALAISALLSNDAPHGGLALLLSLPVAVLPLSGGLRARNAATLRLVVGGTQRTYAIFTLWLVIGLLMSGYFIRLMPLLGQ